MKKGRWKVWLMALRPATLLTGLAPILVGVAVSLNEGVQGDVVFWLKLLSAIGITMILQGAANLVNDVKDFEKGVDEGVRMGPLRATQAGLLSAYEIKRAYRMLFLLAFLWGALLCLESGGQLFLLGLACVAAAFLYSGGPRPLSHFGLGELLALVFFGPVAVAGTTYLLVGSWPFSAIFYGLAPGLLAAAMMAINNLRDLQGDKRAGKRTLAVFLGENKARQLPRLGLWTSLLVAATFGLASGSWGLVVLLLIPLICFISFVILPLIGVGAEAEQMNRALKRVSLVNLALGLSFLAWSL